jgi:hypothetical protein
MVGEDYNLDVELVVLKALFQKRKFAKQIIMQRTLSDGHFTKLFHKDALKLFFQFYIKNGQPPTLDQAIHYLKRYVTYIDKYRSKEEQNRIWKRLIKRLFLPIKKGEMRTIETSIKMLDEFRKMRVIKQTIIDSTQNLNVGNCDMALNNFHNAISDSRKFEVQISEGNIIDDLDSHLQLDKAIKNGEFRPISTHIYGVYEKGNDIKKADLDGILSGGFYLGEMLIFVGEVNVGKSFTLMETAYCTSRFEKKNSILFTIEMNKIKSERRIYSRATGIPYEKFKMGKLTKEDREILEQWKYNWKKNKYGIFEVISFDKGASVLDIENKTKDIENKYGEQFELIAVDYLNDLRPLGRFQSSKSWDAIGEVSWDLTNLAKGYEGSRGLAVITASQKKTTQYGRSETKAGSAAMSALPEHHATVAIGIGQNDEDKAYGIHGRIRYDIFKNRDGEKDISFFTFPDFRKSRIHSVKSMRKHYGDKIEDMK